VSMSDVIVED